MMRWSSAHLGHCRGEIICKASWTVRCKSHRGLFFLRWFRDAIRTPDIAADIDLKGKLEKSNGFWLIGPLILQFLRKTSLKEKVEKSNGSWVGFEGQSIGLLTNEVCKCWIEKKISVVKPIDREKVFYNCKDAKLTSSYWKTTTRSGVACPWLATLKYNSLVLVLTARSLGNCWAKPRDWRLTKLPLSRSKTTTRCW